MDGFFALVGDGDRAARRETGISPERWGKDVVLGSQSKGNRCLGCNDDIGRSVIGQGLVGLVVGVDVW